MKKCIKRKLEYCFGLNWAIKLKNHIWFRDFDWRALYHKKMKAPFVPSSIMDNLNKSKIKK